MKREVDTLARMGGDEFYLLINDFNIPNETAEESSLGVLHEGARKIADAFRTAVEKDGCGIVVNGTRHSLSCRMSIGTVIFPDEALDGRELCRLADESMYRDKHRKRSKNAVEVSFDMADRTPAVPSR